MVATIVWWLLWLVDFIYLKSSMGLGYSLLKPNDFTARSISICEIKNGYNAAVA